MKKTNLELRQSRDFGEIISDTILFIGQNWKTLGKTYFIFCGFFVGGSVLFSILFQFKVVNLHNSTINSYTALSSSIFTVEYLMLILFAFFNAIAVICTTLSYITLYNEKDNTVPTLEEVWTYFKYYFLRVTGSTLLLGLIMVLAVIICAIPAGLSFAVGGRYVGPILGMLFFIIPLVYFFTVLTLFYPIMIIENGSFGHSFGKCFKLTRGKWWSTFGVVFVAGVIIYACYLAVALPFGIISGGGIALLAYNVSSFTIIIYSVLVSLLHILSVLGLIAVAITYFSYIEDKENVGLMERITELNLGAIDQLDDIDPVKDEY